jgi:DNA-binding transcriptional ArsR family regulator
MFDAHRDFKDRPYGQLARLAKALSSPHRLEILELLAQGERTVDSLAGEIGLSLANSGSEPGSALGRRGASRRSAEAR